MVFREQEGWRERLRRLGVSEDDVEETFVRGTGPGGQKVNKTASTVRLRHRPTGVEVRCQEERSQALNRQRAWERLCEALEARRQQERAACQHQQEKERRRRRPRPAGVKRRLVESKRHRSRLKTTRRRVGEE